MRILHISGFRRCIDGTILKEYAVDMIVTREMVSYLEHFGTAKVLDNLRQPFFTFSKGGLFTIKGMVGDTRLYVRFRKEHMDLSADLLHEMIVQYDRDRPGIEAVQVVERRVLSQIGG